MSEQSVHVKRIAEQDTRALLDDLSDIHPDYITQVSEIKRVLERWIMDPEFQEEFDRNPEQALSRVGVSRSPCEILPLVNNDEALSLREAEANGSDGKYPISVRRYRGFLKEKVKSRGIIRENSQPTNPDFATWRSRQINRCLGELGYAKAEAIIHSPIAFELNKGCSVGCWFCAVAAERLSKIWPYSEENGKLWRDTLQVVKHVIGPAVQYGVCYWATEPLDNPDYEKFIADFHQILGRCPQTTTAVPTRDLNRTANLLKLARELDSHIDRFSVLTLRVLDQIHSAFTPEELLQVELVPQNVEAAPRYRKVKAGRARLACDTERHHDNVVQEETSSTIACVSGFKINMPEQSIELITPCAASSTWPLGYWVLDTDTFETAADLQVLLRAMIERNMASWLRVDDVIQLRPDLVWQSDGDMHSIRSEWLSLNFEKQPNIHHLEELITRGDLTAGDIALRREADCGIRMEETFLLLNGYFGKGLLCEDPAIRGSMTLNSDSTLGGIQLVGTT